VRTVKNIQKRPSDPDRRLPVGDSRRNRLRVHTGGTPSEGAILAAAEELLDSQGLHELSVSAIVAAADVARPTFYFYFPSKFAVVATLLQRVFDEILETVQPWLSRRDNESPQELLRSALQTAAGLWHQHGAAIRAAHENAHAAPELGAVWFAIMERFRAILCEEIRNTRAATGAAGGIDAELLSATLIWSSERVLYMSTRNIDPRLSGPDAAVEGLLAIWVPAIYGCPYIPPPAT
jgi:AcrR family transcriptional regulator